MCVVSNIGDYGRKTWPSDPWPKYVPYVPADPTPWKTYPVEPKPYTGPTKEQFEEFLELLRAARKFDVATGQAECPSEEKIGWIRGFAKQLGISDDKLKEIFA